VRTLRLLDTGRLSAAANMALDRIILEGVADGTSPPTLRFLRFSPAAVLVGYHQDVNLEIRKDYCEENGIDINRRHTGGGSILFQESAVGWEIVAVPGVEPFVGSYESILHSICSIAASGISRLGVHAHFRPRNDIEVQGRKISGTGGTTISGAFMFQGTLLVENEVEFFLKALRVPVEKLKKREIESLMERICFLSDLVHPTPSFETIKEAIAEEFEEKLGVSLAVAGLSESESRRLDEETDYFQSEQWIMARSRPPSEGEPLRSITQTEAGTMRVHLWLAPGGRRVRQALIVGDFFTVPTRLVHDLEAALVGVPASIDSLKSAVSAFFHGYEGQILGIAPERVADAVAAAGERLHLLGGDFSRGEVNELFFLNIKPEELSSQKPKWLLLPYCSKSLACPYRDIPGCDECGACEIGDCYALARSFGLDPITVQSFEHLMEVLRERCANQEGMYVGSCCEAFYSKHQSEMEEVDARGLLINLDSTTCYDLGKGSDAYKGRFDNKTFLNIQLIEKALRHLND
jgi:lipoate-protein ligase A